MVLHLALSVSDIPFEGPIAGIQIGLIDGKFIVNPTPAQLEKSELDLVVAGTKDAINMVEAGAQEVAEDIILEAIMFGHGEIIKLIEFQEKIIAEVGKAKTEVALFHWMKQFCPILKIAVKQTLSMQSKHS